MTERTPETEQILVLIREYAYAVMHAKSFAAEEWALDVIKGRIDRIANEAESLRVLTRGLRASLADCRNGEDSAE